MRCHTQQEYSGTEGAIPLTVVLDLVTAMATLLCAGQSREEEPPLLVKACLHAHRTDTPFFVTSKFSRINMYYFYSEK